MTNDKKENKEIAIVFIVILVMVTIGIIASKISSEEIANENAIEKRQSNINQVETICIEYGLEDVFVKLQDEDRFDYNKVTIECSNLDSLEPNKIISLNNKMYTISEIKVTSYKSNKDYYVVYDDVIVFKNSKKIYEGIKTSDTSYEESKERLTNEAEKNKKITDDEKATCWVLAIKEVKSSLKSPSSAEFPYSYASEGVSISKDGSTYYVTGWVDADNSFGAKLRNSFKVTLKKERDSFKVISCSLSD